jgi:phosphoglucosamine mutase
MSERKLFGTDGIRGVANVYPMTGEIALALGRAVTYYFQKQSKHTRQPLIIVGKDTRLSCYMIEQAFAAGVCSQGGKVILTSPLPTPGVAFVTQSMRADAGVMISASHNPYHHNGIKLFDANGFKLPDEAELEIEKLVFQPNLMPLKTEDQLGNTTRLKQVFGRYVVNVKSVLPNSIDLEGMRIVLDCANGAGYKVAPMVMEELGAEVITHGVNPNGTNINVDCGSLYPGKATELVKKYRADLGICLDGDADRVLVIDKEGTVVDGDKLIGVAAKLMLDKGEIKKGDEVVGTVMSNLGLENYIKSLGLKFHRTKVGDRYIIEHMRESGSLLGGEPSGHVIYGGHSTTGDGCLAALKVIEAIRFYNKPLSELVADIPLYPQLVKNAAVSKKIPLDTVEPLQKSIEKAEEKLGDKGRVLIRYSGTEALARVMVEAEDQALVTSLCDELTKVVEKSLK